MSWRTVESTGGSFWLFNDRDGAQLFLEHEVAGRLAAFKLVEHLYGAEAAHAAFTRLENERRFPEPESSPTEEPSP